jgi:hypothetical protein
MILLSMMMAALNLLPETGLFPQTILPQPRPTQDDSLALKMTLELKQHAMKCNITDVLGVFSGFTSPNECFTCPTSKNGLTFLVMDNLQDLVR